MVIEYVIAEDATVLGFYREFETSQDRDNLKSQLMKHASGTVLLNRSYDFDLDEQSYGSCDACDEAKEKGKGRY
jgi:hypothetical protein